MISRVNIRAMTRSDLIAALASRFPKLMAKDVEITVKEILDAIGQSLARGDRIEIRGFGSFGLNYRPPRIGRTTVRLESGAIRKLDNPFRFLKSVFHISRQDWKCANALISR